jgi:hypothetical protein
MPGKFLCNAKVTWFPSNYRALYSRRETDFIVAIARTKNPTHFNLLLCHVNSELLDSIRPETLHCRYSKELIISSHLHTGHP